MQRLRSLRGEWLAGKITLRDFRSKALAVLSNMSDDDTRELLALLKP